MVCNTTIYYLYTITNTLDGTKYVGITNDLVTRFREHKTGTASNKYLKIAQTLLGIDNFTYEVCCIGTTNYISDLEKLIIAKYKALGVPLYNIALGGLIGNGSPGEEHWNCRITAEDVLHMRQLYASNKITQRKLSEEYGISYKQVSKIIRGERWNSIGGPLSYGKQEISKVANRRKLTDTQVVELRYLAKEEYLLLGSIDTVEIANLYNVARGNIRLILIGKSYPNLPGPIRGVDYDE